MPIDHNYPEQRHSSPTAKSTTPAQASSPESSVTRLDAIYGCLLGMAVGDALGLPREGLSPRRAQKLFGTGELRHRLVFGRGMISDDTEHACMTAQALLQAGENAERFRTSLAWRLRWWLLGGPAGVGLGTLRAILKLWIGYPPSHSGVNSAGNGPAMRAPIIGVLLSTRTEALEATVEASTRVTHTDPRAAQGAMAIALAAAYAATHVNQSIQWQHVLEQIRAVVTGQELLAHLGLVEQHLQQRSSPETLAHEMGLSHGVTGYINHTVPIALFCWLRYLDDYRQCVTQAIGLGGDTDTVAAITGALAGIRVGKAGMPSAWITNIGEWPRSTGWLERLADQLARQFPDHGVAETVGPQALFWPGQLLRNVLFAVIVIGHGFRRLLPPY